jgi:NADPH:quinone reductase-like Zn-dependent oxidoreductase
MTTTESYSAATVPAMMRAAVARRYGTPGNVVVEQIPVPEAKRTEVLVRVEASSLNALDWHFLTGTPYLIRIVGGVVRPRRKVPGADVAGTVVGVGPDVTRFAPGDRVFGETPGGGCGEYLTVDETHLGALPDGVSATDAAATPVAGLTALQALRTHAAVRPGEHVLVNGAAGGVGTYTVQIAIALGARVTAVCSTGNVEMVRSLGADRVVDYTCEDFTELETRFDVMVDNVGNRSADEILPLLAAKGRYVAVSGPKENKWFGPMPHIARLALRFRRESQTLHQFTASPDADDMLTLSQFLESRQVVPQVQEVVGLDGVADGLAQIGTGHTRAKIIVIPVQNR